MPSTTGPILLAHGGGGQLTDELVSQLLLPRLGNPALAELLDSGLVDLGEGRRLALTIDGYVVQPVEFPGGDIGRLAVCGTVNDLAVCGARPLGLALSLILEEGLDRAVLGRILDSVAAAAREAGVNVITGDTKVVARGQADGLYIATSGVGVVEAGRRLQPDQVRAGDAILVSGYIGEHGLAVMLARQMPEMHSVVRSDVAPLNGLIAQLLEAVPGVTGELPGVPGKLPGELPGELPGGVRFLRDATRGGVAGVAADLAARSGWHVVLEEERIPVRPAVRHAAEMLGLDVLEVANEGKLVAVVAGEAAEAALAALTRHPLGQDARIIGRVEGKRDGLCELHTAIGGRRVVQKPYGEQLPRIC